jgi:hypothetical protein
MCPSCLACTEHTVGTMYIQTGTVSLPLKNYWKFFIFLTRWDISRYQRSYYYYSRSLDTLYIVHCTNCKYCTGIWGVREIPSAFQKLHTTHNAASKFLRDNVTRFRTKNNSSKRWILRMFVLFRSVFQYYKYCFLASRDCSAKN